jgi:hypothetical protein
LATLNVKPPRDASGLESHPAFFHLARGAFSISSNIPIPSSTSASKWRWRLYRYRYVTSVRQDPPKTYHAISSVVRASAHSLEPTISRVMSEPVSPSLLSCRSRLILIDTQLKPYICPNCSKGFARVYAYVPLSRVVGEVSNKRMPFSSKHPTLTGAKGYSPI